MKKLYNTPEMLVSAFSPKASIAAVFDGGISTPDEEIEDSDDTTSEGGE